MVILPPAPYIALPLIRIRIMGASHKLATRPHHLRYVSYNEMDTAHVGHTCPQRVDSATSAHIFLHSDGDRRNQHGRDLHAIEFFQRPVNIPSRQASGRQDEHLLIKPLQALLLFRHQHRLKAVCSTTERLEGKSPVGHLHDFRGAPIARILGHSSSGPCGT